MKKKYCNYLKISDPLNTNQTLVIYLQRFSLLESAQEDLYESLLPKADLISESNDLFLSAPHQSSIPISKNDRCSKE